MDLIMPSKPWGQATEGGMKKGGRGIGWGRGVGPGWQVGPIDGDGVRPRDSQGDAQ